MYIPNDTKDLYHLESILQPNSSQARDFEPEETSSSCGMVHNYFIVMLTDF